MRSAETVLGIIHDHDLRSWRTLESRVLRKAQARFGEGRLEKCRQRQLASRLLYVVEPAVAFAQAAFDLDPL